MRALVYWCRWHGATLRLMGRDEAAVWGELVLPEGSRRFRFNFDNRELTLDVDEGPRSIWLDEMGVEVARPA